MTISLFTGVETMIAKRLNKFLMGSQTVSDRARGQAFISKNKDQGKSKREEITGDLILRS